MPGYRKLPSGLWQATVRLPDGGRRTRTDPLKGVVKAWAEDAEAAIRRGEWADPQDGRITVAQWYRDWLATRVLEKATAAKYASHWRTHVEPRWGSVRLMAVTSWDVESWVADMQRRRVGATSLAQSFQLFRYMMADAVRHKRLMADPTAGVKVPKAPKHVDRFLSLAEYEALEAAMPSDRDRCIVRLMAYGGLRWGEVAGLHAHRVDLRARRLTVVEVLRRDATVKEQPKSTAGQRYVPLERGVVELLGSLLPVSGLVFPSLHYTNWRRRVFVPAVEAAGLAEPLPTIHDLRHTFGSWLAANGVPPTDIMALMGHSTLRATERYLHSGDSRFDRALTALPVRQIGG